MINSHCNVDPTQYPTHIKSLERRTHYTRMHWNKKSSLISPFLKSFTPKFQSEQCDEISCSALLFDGFESGHLGDAQVRSWTQRRPLLSSAPGEWWSDSRRKWHFSESNNSANKCDGGQTCRLRFAEAFFSFGWMYVRWLKWNYQHVADRRGCELFKEYG